MMEIIHDIAPGTTQAFHTAEGGQANFAQGIIELANAGAKVINDDIIYFREPMFQDRPRCPGGRPGEGARGQLLQRGG